MANDKYKANALTYWKEEKARIDADFKAKQAGNKYKEGTAEWGSYDEVQKKWKRGEIANAKRTYNLKLKGRSYDAATEKLAHEETGGGKTYKKPVKKPRPVTSVETQLEHRNAMSAAKNAGATSSELGKMRNWPPEKINKWVTNKKAEDKK